MLPEIEVGDRGCGRQHRLAVVDELGREQINGSENAEHSQHSKKRRKNAADAALIKANYRKARSSDLMKDNRADKVAGNYEENIDANKSPRSVGYSQMKCEYAQDRDGPESVNVCAILKGSLTN